MAGTYLRRYRNGAKNMVAKAKTYGKKKGHDLASIFLDLSISPSTPGTNAVTRFLIPTRPNHYERLDDTDVALEGEHAAETAEQEDNKEDTPRGKAWRGKQPEKRTAKKNQNPKEISELTSLDFVEDEVLDFRQFCKGWEKDVKLSKIGQGGFATVLKMELKDVSDQYSVWKLMPLKPSKGIGSRPYQDQTLIKDAATEVKMLFAMSGIDGFVQFRSAHVVKGFVPDQIAKAHESWAATLDPQDPCHGTHMRDDFSSKSQLWVLMEMTDAGKDLEETLRAASLARKFYSVYETADIFWGIAEALVRGETEAEFEHRDLHPGNVCIKTRHEPLDVTTEHGVPRSSKYEVTLIDYTQSRLTLDSGEVLATAIDESIFQQTDDDPDAQRQYDMYRMMRDIVKRQKKQGVTIRQMWKEYVPMTNVLWLTNMLMALMAVTRNTSGSQEEEDMHVAFMKLELDLRKLSPGSSTPWKYRSARDVVYGFLVNPF